MNNSFDAALKSTLDNETILSENGANIYATSGSKLVDLNFAVSSLRNSSEEQIEKMFSDAFFADPLHATKWLFFARDIRNGMGERRLFRICFGWLANSRPNLVKKLIPLVNTYGRFDDLLMSGLEGELWDSVVDFIAKQLKADLDNADAGKPISLLAKWLPSPTTSSLKTRALAKKLRNALGMDEKTYRKTLSFLRAKLKVVEVDVSANRWSDIDYNAVPSKANLKYKDAFIKHDPERRKAYLAELNKPNSTAKINSAAAFPYDIVHNYCQSQSSRYWNMPLIFKTDDALEAMWKSLPDYIAGNNDGSTICVVDSSGSMDARVGCTSMNALEVAYSLGIYFSEKLVGPFKNKYITFSGKPQYIDMSNCATLGEKLAQAFSHSEVANTDLKKTFMLILKTAVDNKLKQEDLPSNLLILSDMNFDEGTYQYDSYAADKCSLIKEIEDEFAKHGYKMPRIVWWSIIGGYGRNAPIPVTAHKSGAALVSGFSPTIAKMVFSAKTNPYDVLIEALDSKRYQPIEDAYNAS